MPTAEECRQFAEECLRWASEAKTDKKRNACLEVAHSWTQRAARLSGEANPTNKNGPQPPPPQSGH